MTYLFITLQLWFFFSYILHGVSSPHSFFEFPWGHDENKVFVDLYYAIPATIFLDAVILDSVINVG